MAATLELSQAIAAFPSLRGHDGAGTSLRISAGFLQWKRDDQGDWINLIALAAIAGSNADLLSRIARINAGIYPAERPGDNPTAFTASRAGGDPDLLAPLDTAVYPVRVVGDGLGVEISGSREVWERTLHAVEPGRLWRGRWRYVRTADAADPDDDSVAALIQWYGPGRAAVGGPIITEPFTPHVNAGAHQFAAFIGLNGVTGVTIPRPAGAVYFRLGFKSYGVEPRTVLTDLQADDVSSIEDAIRRLVPPDALPNLSARLDELVSRLAEESEVRNAAIQELGSDFAEENQGRIAAIRELVLGLAQEGEARVAGDDVLGDRLEIAERVLVALSGDDPDGDGSFRVGDDHGNFGFRVDEQGIHVPGAVLVPSIVPGSNVDVGDGSGNLRTLLTDEGVMIPGAVLVPNPLPGSSFTFEDERGNHRTLLGSNRFRYGLDYAPAELDARNTWAVAKSSAMRAQIETGCALPIWDFNHFIMDGQSLSVGVEAWPALTTTPLLPGCFMLGRSVRPVGAQTSTYDPVGDGLLHPLIATNQDVYSDAGLLTDAQTAALKPGSNNYGESPLEAAVYFARKLWLSHLQRADDPRAFLASSVGVTGSKIELLLSTASGGYYNRFPGAVQKARAQVPNGRSYGIAALLWMQGESNYTDQFGGVTDYASYKALLRQLLRDRVGSEVVQSIAGQTDRPPVVTYQTSGTYVADAAGMSVSNAQFDLSEEERAWVLAAPSYCVNDKGGHLTANGARHMGLYLGRAWFEMACLRRRWRPLHCMSATIRGRTAVLSFYTPGTRLQFKAVAVADSVADANATIGSRYDPVLRMFADKGIEILDADGSIPIEQGGPFIWGDNLIVVPLAREARGRAQVRIGGGDRHLGSTNICDDDSTEAPFLYEYRANSGMYAAENIPALVGKPYALNNFCALRQMPVALD